MTQGCRVIAKNSLQILRAPRDSPNMAKLITSALAMLSVGEAFVLSTTGAGPSRAQSVQMNVAALPEVDTVLSAAAPGEWEGKEGKHVPQLTVEDGKATITVPHGMDDDHFINFIWAKDAEGKVVASAELKASDEPKLEFEVPEGCSVLTAYESCNLHSVWCSEPVEM